MLAADPGGAEIVRSADNASSWAWRWYSGAPQCRAASVRFWHETDMLK